MPPKYVNDVNFFRFVCIGSITYYGNRMKPVFASLANVSLIAAIACLSLSPCIPPSQSHSELRRWVGAAVHESRISFDQGTQQAKLLEDTLNWIDATTREPAWERRVESDAIQRYRKIVEESIASKSDLLDRCKSSVMPMRFEWAHGKFIEYEISVPREPCQPGKTYPLVFDLPGIGWVGKKPMYKKNTPGDTPYDHVFAILVFKDTYVHWDIEALNSLLEHLKAMLPIDEKRIYAVGHSQGGSGVWAWAKWKPDLFAAISPCSTWCDHRNITKLLDIPILIAHGRKDPIVWPWENLRIGKKINELGGKVEMVLFKDKGHNIVDWDFRVDQFNWLLSHSKV